MPVFLKALALRNYRGIGDTIQKMPDFRTFNFFIGANNTGKSTVLSFISKYLTQLPKDHPQSMQIEPLEQHGGQSKPPIYMAMGYTIDEAIQSVSLKHPKITSWQYIHNMEKVIVSFADNGRLIWIGSTLPYEPRLEFIAKDTNDLAALLPGREWQQLWSALTNQMNGGLQHWIPDTIRAIEDSLNLTLPPVRLIPAIRQIRQKVLESEDFSGAGLIESLAAIQNPEHDRRSDRIKFERINKFLESVTGRSPAEIEIPYSRQHILVHMDGRVLPLSSLGTGIQEVIMIAAFCTLAENEIICIEEPELHLHPLLQRKLVSYLDRETSNQYFIATHSAAFIDTPGAAIFHVALVEGVTTIREAVLKKDRFSICVDLGQRASDIVQANAVVWVEGPSDRIYLNHWFKTVAPDLVEGTHYSVMFYGGRLLSHLSADDEEVSEFIQLRTLNRHLAILMDSDKASPHSPVNATKKRLRDEFSRHGGVAWITKGREIENYIDHTRLQRAVKTVYSSVYGSAVSGSPFDHALHFLRNTPPRRRKGTAPPDLTERNIDKVKVSRALVHDGASDIDVLDLRERLTEVVKMIRDANR